MPAAPEKLLFVDTNLFLDFYRGRKPDGWLRPLQMLEENKDSLIISSQVEVECIKNHPNVIRKNLDKINLTSPKRGTEVAERIETRVVRPKGDAEHEARQMLKDPDTKDDVYKIIRRIFSHASPYNLSQGNSQMSKIYRLAYRRFCCGYPPRKSSDTSCGDSVNWEWIIQCAVSGRKNVVIASRDSDYGVKIEKERYLNDWLAREFKTRVGQSRTIDLADDILAGLNKIGVETDK